MIYTGRKLCGHRDHENGACNVRGKHRADRPTDAGSLAVHTKNEWRRCAKCDPGKHRRQDWRYY